MGFYCLYVDGVPFRCPIFWGNSLKLPSYIAKSRHGIYYFRLTFRVGFSLKEKRISLRTKNPQEARFKASCLSGIMAVRKQEPQKAMATDHFNTAAHIAEQAPDSDFLLNLLRRTDRHKLAEWPSFGLTDTFARMMSLSEVLHGT